MHERKPLLFSLIAAAAALLIAGGCATVPGSDIDREHLRERAQAALDDFRKADPSLEDSFVESAAGWAVFPSVGKGGAGYGGAFGRGVVYAGGEPVGYCSLTQASIGFQLGGQVYKELIFFEDQAALAEFREGGQLPSRRGRVPARQQGTDVRSVGGRPEIRVRAVRRGRLGSGDRANIAVAASASL